MINQFNEKEITGTIKMNLTFTDNNGNEITVSDEIMDKFALGLDDTDEERFTSAEQKTFDLYATQINTLFENLLKIK